MYTLLRFLETCLPLHVPSSSVDWEWLIRQKSPEKEGAWGLRHKEPCLNCHLSEECFCCGSAIIYLGIYICYHSLVNTVWIQEFTGLS